MTAKAMNVKGTDNRDCPDYLKGMKCHRCGYIWLRRQIEKLPVRCPKCKSPYWNKPRKG